MKSFVAALCLGASIFVAYSNAGRMSDVSQRRGYTKQLMDRSASGIHERQASNTSDLRFYSNATDRE